MAEDQKKLEFLMKERDCLMQELKMIEDAWSPEQASNAIVEFVQSCHKDPIEIPNELHNIRDPIGCCW